MKFSQSIRLTLALLALSGTAMAAEIPSYNVPDIVIYASGDTPDTTVDAAQTNIGAAKTVPELLRYTAGIQIQDRPNAGGNEDLSVKLRGHDSRHFTVLVDGVPYNMAGVMGGSNVNWTAIPLGMVDRIEITKGAKSAAYGQTEGGVINIITKKADVSGGVVQAMAGSKHRRQYTANYRMQGERLGATVYVNKSRKDAYLRNSNYDNEQAGIRMDYRLDDANSFHATLDHQELERGLVVANVPGTPGYDSRYPVTPDNDGFAGAKVPSGDGSYTKIFRNNYTLTWDSRTEDLGNRVTWWKNNEKQREVSINPSGALNFDRYNVTDLSSGLLYQGDVKINDSHRLGYGFDMKKLRYGYGWYNKNVDNSGGGLYPSQKMDTMGFYLEDHWSPDERWTANLGLRYDRAKGDRDDSRAVKVHSFHESAVSPKLNVTLKHDDKTTTSLSVNRIWRAPSMAEFYWHCQGVVLGPMNFASKLPLAPEKGWGYEASVKHRFGDKVESRITGYYQDLKDYINFTHTFPFNAYNINHAKLWGAELENTWQMDKSSALFLNYTNQHTEKDGVKGNDNIGLRGELDYRPRHTLAAGYRFDKDGWHARYDMTWTSSQKATKGFPSTKPMKYVEETIGGYAVHNISLTRDFDTDTSLNFSVFNLFDKEYSEIAGYPMEGRVFTCSLTQRF